MSREPQSAAHRYKQVGGDPIPPAPAPAPVTTTQRARKFRIVVEPEKPKPRSRHADEMGNFQRAVTKLTTTTEALTAQERQIVRGYRLSTGGPAAERERQQIEVEIQEDR